MAPEKLRETPGNITQIGHKMTTIINELLLLVSIRRMDEVRQGPVDMGTTIAEACARLSGSNTELQAEIVQPASWPAAVGYAPWIEEVWANYLSNALKYGGRPARIELGVDELSEVQFRFWILDNGRIIEKLGGQVGAENVPDQGARFWFSLSKEIRE